MLPLVNVPTNQAVLLGGDLTISVTVTGTPPMSFQWLFNSTNLVGGDSPNLTLTNLQFAQAGEYRLFITNQAGTGLSGPMTLSVWVPPSIVSQPQGVTVVAGQSASLQVTAMGSEPLSYFWYKNGAVLGGATNSTLIFTNVSTTNVGSYTVLVSNAVNTVLSSPAVLVVTPATFPLPVPHTAIATAQVVYGFVVQVTVTDFGYGYAQPPVVSLVGGGGERCYRHRDGPQRPGDRDHDHQPGAWIHQCSHRSDCLAAI